MNIFANADALHERALAHIGELERETAACLAQLPYRVFLQPDFASGKMLAKIALAEPIPLTLSCITFDAVNCLRSALDHAVFAASTTLNPEAEHKSIKFPFGDQTEQSVEGEFKGKARAVPEQLRPYLLKLKPYKTGNVGLWGLNQLRNMKIHRMLSPSALGGKMAIHNGVVNIHFVYRWDAAKNELTFAELPPGAWQKFDKSITLKLAFGEETPFPRYDVARGLRELSDLTRGILWGLKAETARLLKEL